MNQYLNKQKYDARMKSKKVQAGLTMIEIMVVVVIIGILAALIVPNIAGRDDQARVSTVKSNLKAIAQALELYKLDNFSYPTTSQGLEALVTNPGDAPNWNSSGYLKKLEKDPWGQPYMYLSPADSGPYEIISYGSDRQEGGEGVAADIILSEL